MTLLIYGPTATGKTALAIKLAKKFNGELISADSRQVYKGLDIGTGKVNFSSKVEKHNNFWLVDGVKIHGFDIIQPGISFSAANFVTHTHTLIIRIIKEKKIPIIVGGTGFYIKSLINGFDSVGIPPDPKLRKELEKLSVSRLYKKLLNLDHIRAKSMNQSDKNNPRRLVRAIEIEIFNKKHETKNNKRKQTTYNIQDTKYLLIGLTAPNQYLYQKADSWLNQRLKKSMIEEIQNLISQKVSISWLENLGLEYHWLTRYLVGNIQKDVAIARLKGDIHSFIRRQKTYFKQFGKNNLSLFDISQKDWQIKLEKKVSLWYIKHSHRT